MLHFSPQLLKVKVVAFQPIEIQQDFSEKSILGALRKGAVFLQAELHIPFFQLLKEISLCLVLIIQVTLAVRWLHCPYVQHLIVYIPHFVESIHQNQMAIYEYANIPYSGLIQISKVHMIVKVATIA